GDPAGEVTGAGQRSGFRGRPRALNATRSHKRPACGPSSRPLVATERFPRCDLPAMPLEIISIELTNRCAKACWFCYNHSLPEGETRWSVEEVVGFVRNCAANGVEERLAYVAADC